MSEVAAHHGHESKQRLDAQCAMKTPTLAGNRVGHQAEGSERHAEGAHRV